ncbi:histidinol-phosphate transaminase [Algihabitans albus]|uniref:histidinol-phosphate transaminase n=1 Tax=Algihabitans albus TaxID=2164067 RepID=UPI000E5D95AB|nr:histidinol-phosphate transaminase [Algihabitans albus]
MSIATRRFAPRPGIFDVEPYVGGEARIPGVTEPIRLAANENPFGPSRKAVEAYAEVAGGLHRYPDGGSTALRDTLAELHGLDAARIVCGNGSDELISLLVRAYAGPGDEVLYSRHGFLMYPIAAKTAGATAVAAPERNLTADVDALLAHASDKTRLVFLANPNNPTGSYLPDREIRRLLDGLPEQALLVLDTAYVEYVQAADYSDGLKLVEETERVVVTRTFSKIYGLAALRLGWAYAPAEVADVLNRLRGPFNVSLPAQVAAVAALGDQEHLRHSAEQNSTWRTWFAEQLARLNIRAEPSEGNFLLVPFADAPAAAAFLKTRGILVRAMAAYGLPGHLRVTVGTEAEMRAVVAALKDYPQ